MTENEYFVGGCTALLDAVGGAIHHIGNVHKYIREEDCPEKTLFVITTDGLENASSRYDFSKVKQMVEQKKITGSSSSLVRTLMRLRLLDDSVFVRSMQ